MSLYGRADQIKVGTMVRVPFSGRQVNGWVLEIDIQPEEGINLLSLSKYRGVGPSSEVIDLARWAAHRWAGRLNRFLTTASPPKNVPLLEQRKDGIGETKTTANDTVWWQEAVKHKELIVSVAWATKQKQSDKEFIVSVAWAAKPSDK